MEIQEKTSKKDILFTILFVIIALHPIIELDYLIDIPFIPRLTTIIDFVVLPVLVILLFWIYEKDKKKIKKYAVIYIIIFTIYFIFHCLSASRLVGEIHLTENFYFSIKDELIYTLVMLLPLAYIYIFYISNIKEKILKGIVLLTSSLISWPVLLSDLFLFGQSTYSGKTYDTIISWFSLPFDHRFFHPRRYACKFFFEEGNTIGILLLIILPLLYYFFYKEKNQN